MEFLDMGDDFYSQVDDVEYYWDEYAYGGIRIDSISRKYGPWSTLTVNLSDYDLMPKEGHVFIPIYKMDPIFYEDFISKFVTEMHEFEFGMFNCKCLDVTLHPDWKRNIKKGIPY